MSVYLLANIGTRDVQLDTFGDIPAELINARTGQLIPRLAGEYLRFRSDCRVIEREYVERGLFRYRLKDQQELFS